MFNFGVNYVAVLVCGVASMILGTLWYGPLFGKPWMKLMGLTEEHMKKAKAKGMAMQYVIMFVGSLLMAYVLEHFVGAFKIHAVNDAAQLAFWLWLGFIAVVQLGSVLWEGKSWKLFWINAAYQLVNLVIIAEILVKMGLK